METFCICICFVATWWQIWNCNMIYLYKYAWAKGIWVDGRIWEQYFWCIVWGWVLGVYGTCRLVLLLSKATGRTQGHCPAGPKGPYFTPIHFTSLHWVMQYSMQCIACFIGCCIGVCFTGIFGIMTVFNLRYDLPTSHRNVLEMVFRVIQITSNEADFPKSNHIIFPLHVDAHSIQSVINQMEIWVYAWLCSWWWWWQWWECWCWW